MGSFAGILSLISFDVTDLSNVHLGIAKLKKNYSPVVEAQFAHDALVAPPVHRLPVRRMQSLEQMSNAEVERVPVRNKKGTQSA
jgi:hypothetical protein